MFEYMPYNVAPWGTELSVYFFLIGMAAMTFVLSAAPNVFGGAAASLSPVQKPGLIITLVIIAVCGVLLIDDLGQPARFLNVLIYFHASSPLSWGSLFLVLFVGSIVLFGWGLIGGSPDILKPVGIIGSIFALLMPLYTGVDMMANQAREVWATPFIPILFVALSGTSGAALMAVLVLIRPEKDGVAVSLLRTIIMASVGITLVLFLIEVINLTYGSAEEQAAWQAINTEMGGRFWFMTLVVGILAPLVLLVSSKIAKNPAIVAVAGIAGVIGAYTFRDVLLVAGQLPQLYF